MATYGEFKMDQLEYVREGMSEAEKNRIINENMRRIMEHFDRLAAMNIA